MALSGELSFYFYINCRNLLHSLLHHSEGSILMLYNKNAPLILIISYNFQQERWKYLIILSVYVQMSQAAKTWSLENIMLNQDTG